MCAEGDACVCVCVCVCVCWGYVLSPRVRVGAHVCGCVRACGYIYMGVGTRVVTCGDLN